MNTQTIAATASNLSVSVDQPVVLEQDGNPVAVLISVADYQRFQELQSTHAPISASQAQRAANRRVFGDLVGCALSCGEPIWAPEPQAHWKVPYRLFDGTLAQVVKVDGYTGDVSLTEAEREDLLRKVVQWANQSQEIGDADD